jgi:hypothetical protein
MINLIEHHHCGILLSARSTVMFVLFCKVMSAGFFSFVTFFLLGLACFKMWLISCHISSAVSFVMCSIARSVLLMVSFRLALESVV